MSIIPYHSPIINLWKFLLDDFFKSCFDSDYIDNAILIFFFFFDLICDIKVTRNEVRF
jgi:hypothetical protein